MCKKSAEPNHPGPENMRKVPRNVYAVDCDEVNTRYDSPKGHAYFLDDGDGNPGKVFEHLLGVIERGRVFPDDREQREDVLPD